MSFAAAVLVLGIGACSERRPDPALLPDSVLRAELGLGDADRVHRIRLRGGEREEISPPSVEVEEGDWVEFVTVDWRVHQVRFEPDSLSGEARAFLEATDQLDSPPLVDRDARFVLSFSGAPEGRYPFVSEGNGAAAGGVVVVLPRR